MNSLSPEFPIAALVSTCKATAPAHAPYLRPVGNSSDITGTYRLAIENSESQSISPRLNQRSLSLICFSGSSHSVTGCSAENSSSGSFII